MTQPVSYQGTPTLPRTLGATPDVRRQTKGLRDLPRGSVEVVLRETPTPVGGVAPYKRGDCETVPVTPISATGLGPGSDVTPKEQSLLGKKGSRDTPPASPSGTDPPITSKPGYLCVLSRPGEGQSGPLLPSDPLWLTEPSRRWNRYRETHLSLPFCVTSWTLRGSGGPQTLRSVAALLLRTRSVGHEGKD